MEIITDREKIKERAKICKECIELIKVVHICSICKCFMPAKIPLANSTCPLGKWSEINSTKQPIANLK